MIYHCIASSYPAVHKFTTSIFNCEWLHKQFFFHSSSSSSSLASSRVSRQQWKKNWSWKLERTCALASDAVTITLDGKYISFGMHVYRCRDTRTPSWHGNMNISRILNPGMMMMKWKRVTMYTPRSSSTLLYDNALEWSLSHHYAGRYSWITM